MLVERKNEIAKIGGESLRHLLQGLEEPHEPYWGFVPDNPDDRVRISGAASQLIESISWLDCQEEAFSRLKKLAQFLTQQAVEDPEIATPVSIALTASRLKSILQYFCHETTVFRQHNAMKNSLEFLLKQNLEGRYEKLCATDLFGYYVSEIDNLDADNALTDEMFRKTVQAKYKALLSWLKRWRTKARNTPDPNTSDHPKDFSFAIWLIYVGGGYGSRKTALTRESLLRDLDHLYQSTQEFDRKARHGQRFSRTTFSRIIYPKLFLSWACRKEPSLTSRYDLDTFYQWFIPTSENLLKAERVDPYIIGLILKLCTAAAKEAVRRNFRETNLSHAISHLHNKTSQEEQATRTLLTRVIKDRLAVRIDKVKRLTGGWSPAHVWKAEGSYDLPLGGNDGGSFAFIIKTGTRANFQQAASLYQALAPEARDLFPGHDPEPSAVTHADAPLFYLIMEELHSYEPLAGRVVQKIPADPTAATDRRSVFGSVQLGLDAIENLHSVRAPAQPEVFPRHRLTQSKIGEMFALLEDLKDKSNNLRLLSELRVISGEPASANALHLLGKTINGIGKIVPPINGERRSIVHGDCHGNNIMLPPRGSKALFIDIDGLQFGDYLQDYAELYCHLCLSLDLELISSDQLTFSVKGEGKDALLECDYDSSRLWDIQRGIAGLIVKSALKEGASRDDSEVTARLCLLIANRLFFIASKAPHESKAVILFCRALAFLDNVCRWLAGSKTIEIPFTAISAEDMQMISAHVAADWQVNPG